MPFVPHGRRQQGAAGGAVRMVQEVLRVPDDASYVDFARASADVGIWRIFHDGHIGIRVIDVVPGPVAVGIQPHLDGPAHVIDSADKPRVHGAHRSNNHPVISARVVRPLHAVGACTAAVLKLRFVGLRGRVARASRPPVRYQCVDAGLGQVDRLRVLLPGAG